MNIEITYKNLNTNEIETVILHSPQESLDFNRQAHVYITGWHAKFENGNRAGGRGRNADVDMIEVMEELI